MAHHNRSEAAWTPRQQSDETMAPHQQDAQALAFISLGSNIGARERWLQQAIEMLHGQEAIEVIGCSSMYETEPVDFLDQPPFINMVIAVQTTLSPTALLDVMLGVEGKLGRIRTIKNGPRTIDLDILLYNDVQLETAQLTLPHPRMYERCFVLVPLAELVAETKQLTAEQHSMLSEGMLRCNEQNGVTLWKRVDWQKESGRFAN